MPSGEIWETQTEGRYQGRRAYRFTGKELDVGANLYYFDARWYDARQSQWITPDPILEQYMGGQPNGGVYDPLHLAVYTHTANNPLRFIDPTGTAERCVDGICESYVGPEDIAGQSLDPGMSSSPAPEEELRSRLAEQDRQVELVRLEQYDKPLQTLLLDPIDLASGGITGAVKITGKVGGKLLGKLAARQAAKSELAVINAQVGNSVVDRSAIALATARGETVTTLNGINTIQLGGQRLAIVAHGSPASLGGLSAKDLAAAINAGGTRPAFIELVACQTGRGTFASELAGLTGTAVKAPLGNVNVLSGVVGVPQVRIGGQLAAPGVGFRVFLPVVQ